MLKIRKASRNKSHKMDEDLIVGDYGEYRVKKYFDEHHDHLLYGKDVTLVPKYQQKDIDFIMNFSGVEYTLEMKTDKTLFKNLFFETSSSIHNGKHYKGCMGKTEADIILYFYGALDIAFIAPAKALKRKAWEIIREDNLKEKKVFNSTYESRGYAIPLERLSEIPNSKFVYLRKNQEITYSQYDKFRQQVKNKIGSFYTCGGVPESNTWIKENEKLWA